MMPYVVVPPAYTAVRSHRLGRNGLCTIRSRFRIARGLLDAAGSGLSRSGSLLSLGGGSFSARRRRIGTISGIDSLLRGVGLIRGTACQQRKG